MRLLCFFGFHKVNKFYNIEYRNYFRECPVCHKLDIYDDEHFRWEQLVPFQNSHKTVLIKWSKNEKKD